MVTTCNLQTLWRWRARVIPQGLRYRNKTIVFTRAQVEAIRDYSNRLELADSPELRRASGVAPAASKGDP